MQSQELALLRRTKGVLSARCESQWAREKFHTLTTRMPALSRVSCTGSQGDATLRWGVQAFPMRQPEYLVTGPLYAPDAVGKDCGLVSRHKRHAP